MDVLRPSNKHLVYDLVREAGLDVSDWANYRRPESPAANPKYCYEWAFWNAAKKTVVLCLWFSAMKNDRGGIFQSLN